MSGPLTGVQVVEAATLFAGPLAATYLGDLGADVVKIEHPSAAGRVPRPRPEQERHRAVVEDDRPQQARGHARPVVAAWRTRSSSISSGAPTS